MEGPDDPARREMLRIADQYEALASTASDPQEQAACAWLAVQLRTGGFPVGSATGRMIRLPPDRVPEYQAEMAALQASFQELASTPMGAAVWLYRMEMRRQRLEEGL